MDSVFLYKQVPLDSELKLLETLFCRIWSLMETHPVVAQEPGSIQLILLNPATLKRRESAVFSWKKGATLKFIQDAITRHATTLVRSWSSEEASTKYSEETFDDATIQFVNVEDHKTVVDIEAIVRGKVKADIHIVFTCPDVVADGRSQKRFMELMSWNKRSSLNNKEPVTVIPWSEKHNTAADCWVVLNDQVYDITHYLDFHPGGRQILLPLAGKDITVSFYRYHPWVNASLILKNNHIGRIETARDKTGLSNDDHETGIARAYFLEPPGKVSVPPKRDPL